nr:hypothetical protein WG33_0344 [uncultured bacterium]
MRQLKPPLHLVQMLLTVLLARQQRIAQRSACCQRVAARIGGMTQPDYFALVHLRRHAADLIDSEKADSTNDGRNQCDN